MRRDEKKKSTNRKASRESRFKGKRREDRKGRHAKDPRDNKPKLQLYTPKSWSPKGEAVYMDGRRRMLLWGGIPKEPAFYRLIHRGQNQSMFDFVYSKNPHPERIEGTTSAQCSCCPLMHMTPKGQHDAKLQMLRSHLQEHGLEEHTPTEMHMGNNRLFRYQVKLVVAEEDGKMMTRKTRKTKLDHRSSQGQF